MKFKIPSIMIATGLEKSSVFAAFSKIDGRIAEVGVDIVGGAFRCAGQQGSGVHEHKRIVVDVHDPGLGRYALGELVCVVTVGSPVPMSRNCRMPCS